MSYFSSFLKLIFHRKNTSKNWLERHYLGRKLFFLFPKFEIFPVYRPTSFFKNVAQRQARLYFVRIFTARKMDSRLQIPRNIESPNSKFRARNHRNSDGVGYVGGLVFEPKVMQAAAVVKVEPPREKAFVLLGEQRNSGIACACVLLEDSLCRQVQLGRNQVFTSNANVCAEPNSKTSDVRLGKNRRCWKA